MTESNGGIEFVEGTPTDIMFGPLAANRCYFIDNVDGMAMLPDGCVDLGFTDPPFNVGFKGISGYEDKRKDRKCYPDERPDYGEWCLKWHDLHVKKCRGVMMTPGSKNLYFWVSNREPSHLPHYIHLNNTTSFRTVLVFYSWGVIPRIGSLPEMMSFPVEMNENIQHACPRTYSPWLYYLKKLRPESVMDIFLGSGTTAEACEELGIPWIGFEKEIAFKKNIETRIGRGIEKRKQKESTKERTVGDL